MVHVISPKATVSRSTFFVLSFRLSNLTQCCQLAAPTLEARLVSRLLGLKSQEDWYNFVEADAVRSLTERVGCFGWSQLVGCVNTWGTSP